jgi:peptidoglycan/xylan/chitin deacetylase (PgdA/CDA1 family)
VRVSGSAAVLLRSGGEARFAFTILNAAPPPAWQWRVVADDGEVVAQGNGASSGAVGVVTWSGRTTAGGRADPGLYRVQVAAALPAAALPAATPSTASASGNTASASGNTASASGNTGNANAAGSVSGGTAASTSPGGGTLSSAPSASTAIGVSVTGVSTIGLVRYQPPVTAQVVRRLPAAGNRVALTFDGGSGYAWRAIMKELQTFHVQGSFFCTGVSVQHYPQMARIAVNQGDTLGSHSYDHPDFTTISDAQITYQLTKAEDIWWQAAQVVPAPYFRPPYGAYNARVLKVAGQLGYARIVLWDVDTGDWQSPPPAVIVARVLAAARPGSIVLMHTDWPSEKALPAIIRGLLARGLQPVNLDQLFRAAGYH